MAQPSNSFDTYDAKGNREALADIIYNISPTDTPFLTMAAQGKATATYEEWQTDELASAVTTNAVIEGDEATLDASVATTRVGNYTQIADKTVVITGTQEVVNHAGRKSELAYQIAKKGKELKRDMESQLTSNTAQVAGNSTTARKSAGLGAWIATNDVLGTGSAASPTGNGTNARTDGTQRALLESHLKTAVQNCWSEGGNPSSVMVGPFNKTVISGFTGNSTRMDKGEDKKLFASIDVYESDFGALQIQPSRFSRERDVWVLDPEMWEVRYLRPFQQFELSKTGDSEKRQLLTEYVLVSRQEKASGMVADCTTS
tara:strand:+ start:153 stop:1100 length:948 start_codon:yes stop_codon:yes gene_type:complete